MRNIVALSVKKGGDESFTGSLDSKNRQMPQVFTQQ